MGRVVIVMLLLAVVLAACASAVPVPSPSPASPSAAASASADDPGVGEPLVRVASRGGLCPDGPCAGEAAVWEDGRVRRMDRTDGWLDAGAVAAVRRGIADADWAALLGRPFTGLCPTATDGTELTWTIRTPGRLVEAASCSVEIPYEAEPFRTLWPILFATGERG